MEKFTVEKVVSKQTLIKLIQSGNYNHIHFSSMTLAINTFHTFEGLLAFLVKISLHNINVTINNLSLAQPRIPSVFLKNIYLEWSKASREQKSHRVSSSLQKAKRAGMKIGRPNTVNTESVRTLRMTGKTIRQIAKELKISSASVHRSL